MKTIMADVVIVRCLFTFLIINTCYAGLSDLENLDRSGSLSTFGAEKQLVDSSMSVNKMMVHHPKYKCHMCDPPNCDELPTPDDIICHDSLSCFKSSVRDSDGTFSFSRGCLTKMDQYKLTCKSNRAQTVIGMLNITCCEGDFCNAGEFPDLPLTEETSIERLSSNAWLLCASIISCALIICILAAIAVFILRRSHRLRVSRAALNKLGADSNYFTANMYSPPVTSAYYEDGSQNGVLKAVAAGDSTLREYLECSVTSGSGSGLPLMVQRTLAKQITLLDCVGKGRYGEVWRGLWYADNVAVKIFFSRDEASWRRETEIYSTVLLRHDNILAYIGSDMISRNSCTQLWLITHYHPLGSLYEHLSRATLTREQMMIMCLSIVNGLLHLHTEIHGTQGKPSIAHRDIKSKNILVKVNGECCIADLGLAVTNQHIINNQIDNPRQGTKRYMSPEVLDETINKQNLEAYRRCDLYALGLVMWEVCSRVSPCKAYCPPYYPLTRDDPSFQEMKKVVCLDQARPVHHPSKHPTMISMASLISECWHDNPSVRLPALRVKKTLLKIANNDPEIYLNGENEVSV